MVKPGIMTKDIDRVVHDETVKRNSYPSPLNYHGFPKSCCTSVNEVICHGIPDTTVLQEGDVVNIDVTIFHDGVHGDCSETVFVGKVSEEVRSLTITTYEAWTAAIAHCGCRGGPPPAAASSGPGGGSVWTTKSHATDSQ